ncbi:sphingosine-1-phosphate lyase-like [Ostrea edulis]|uniref:sphingosine-1-phosphate lyase-like n=1 Tax=Ostrea edulis TaxID=37623 RepID=UPI0024AF94BA|nr:sphingosine-1-phosphate lyase-like [Ostrea edulis]
MLEWVWTLEHILFSFIIVILTLVYINRGREELFRILVIGLKQLPGVEEILRYVLRRQVNDFVQNSTLRKSDGSVPKVVIPKIGIPTDQLRTELSDLKGKETNPEEGKIFAYVYTQEDDHFDIQTEAFKTFQEKLGYSVEHDSIVKEFHHAFLHENALNPMVFPSLRKMETEIVSMTAGILNGSDECVGFLTSGGTESNLMAVKTYLNRAKKMYPTIKNPEIIAPITIHPTIDKAADYFGLTVIHTPVDKDFRADVRAIEKAITPNTILLCASAPQFCHGIIDPIEEISHLALKKGLPLHVDACFGGYMLPWVEKLGYEVPPFDFRVPGVTSMSADVHKYGYGVKGSSVIIYRNNDYRRYQVYTYAQWPGGLYGSPSMAGTRPGGNIAASWVAIRALGEDGYMKRAKELMEATEQLKQGVRDIQGLKILGTPHMTCFAVGAADPEIDIQAVADDMDSKGWKMERNQNPSSLHLSILPSHIPVVSDLLTDLKASTERVKGDVTLSKNGTAGVYGMISTIPDKSIIDDFLVEFFCQVYT